MNTESAAQPSDESTDGGGLPTIEEMQAKLDAANAEAAKERGIRKKLQQERDAAKRPADTSKDEDYKQLWQQEADAKAKLLERVKSTAIEGAVKAQLLKAGVLEEAVDAAANLIDRSMVTWDEEGGVEGVTVNAAVSKLKSKFGFMFEKKVNATSPKAPADGSSNNDAKEISRSDFDRLDPLSKATKMRAGFKVTD